MRLPIPPIRLAQAAGRYTVVDGVQQVVAVLRFLSREYTLTGSTYRHDLDGRAIHTMAPADRDAVMDASFNTIEMTSLCSESSLY